jgi:hypothetical protein
MWKNLFAIHRRTLLALFFLASENTLSSQSDHQQDLKSILVSEQQRYSLLTYSQHYRGHDNQAVDYSGTLYLRIESFSLDDCNLKINVVVQDNYSGSEKQQRHLHQTTLQTGKQSFTDRYTYQLNLKDFDSIEPEPISARPTQLHNDTGFVCQEDKACRLQWLRIKVAKPKIREIRIWNGFVAFDKPVSEITIPLTSSEIASQLAKTLENITISCHLR